MPVVLGVYSIAISQPLAMNRAHSAPTCYLAVLCKMAPLRSTMCDNEPESAKPQE